MTREKVLELSSTIKIKALPLREQGRFIKLVSKIMTDFDNLADIVTENWDDVMKIFIASLVGGEEEVEKIQGFDETIEVLIGIFEVNGGPNVIARLTPLAEGAATAGQTILKNTSIDQAEMEARKSLIYQTQKISS